MRAKDREERKRVVRPGDAQVQREPEAWARATGLQADRRHMLKAIRRPRTQVPRA